MVPRKIRQRERWRPPEPKRNPEQESESGFCRTAVLSAEIGAAVKQITKRAR